MIIKERGGADFEFLIEAGFQDICATSVSDLNCVSNLAVYDLVIINVITGKGYEIASALRRSSLNIGIILIVSAGDKGYGYRAFRSGANNYLVRPFDPRLLLAIVRSLIRRLL